MTDAAQPTQKNCRYWSKDREPMWAWPFDGDADRLIVVDEKGNVIDGDRVIAICARMLKEQGRLAENKATVTVMSNIGFHKAMEESGIDVDVTGVGDRYVLEQMLKSGCVIGGEQSGHIIFRNIPPPVTVFFLPAIYGSCSCFRQEDLRNGIGNTDLSAGTYQCQSKNENKKKYSNDPQIAAAIEEIEKKMEGKRPVLIRPSGTEPLVRVMIEGDDEVGAGSDGPRSGRFDRRKIHVGERKCVES